VAAGEISPDHDCETTAGFILSALQGAVLLAKVQRSGAAAERLRAVVFGKVLC
jgi:TetR/AcrR family transcriptional repressor of nem operon